MNSLEFAGDNLAEMFAAYTKAQDSMGAVVKGSVNPAFKSKYADLATVTDIVIPAFNKAGFAVIQSPSFDGEIVTVETIMAHSSGSYMRSALSIRPSKMDAHGIGSATTYARRYALLSLSGAAPEDDDGNAPSGPQEAGKRFSAYDRNQFTPRLSSAEAKRQGLDNVIRQELAACQTEKALDAWFENFDERTATFPLAWDIPMRDLVEIRRNELLDLAAEREAIV